MKIMLDILGYAIGVILCLIVVVHLLLYIIEGPKVAAQRKQEKREAKHRVTVTIIDERKRDDRDWLDKVNRKMIGPEMSEAEILEARRKNKKS